MKSRKLRTIIIIACCLMLVPFTILQLILPCMYLSRSIINLGVVQETIGCTKFEEVRFASNGDVALKVSAYKSKVGAFDKMYPQGKTCDKYLIVPQKYIQKAIKDKISIIIRQRELAKKREETHQAKTSAIQKNKHNLLSTDEETYPRNIAHLKIECNPKATDGAVYIVPDIFECSNSPSELLPANFKTSNTSILSKNGITTLGGESYFPYKHGDETFHLKIEYNNLYYKGEWKKQSGWSSLAILLIPVTVVLDIISSPVQFFIMGAQWGNAWH